MSFARRLLFSFVPLCFRPLFARAEFDGGRKGAWGKQIGAACSRERASDSTLLGGRRSCNERARVASSAQSDCKRLRVRASLRQRSRASQSRRRSYLAADTPLSRSRTAQPSRLRPRLFPMAAAAARRKSGRALLCGVAALCVRLCAPSPCSQGRALPKSNGLPLWQLRALNRSQIQNKMLTK